MMRVIDYSYYRIYAFYKRKKDDNPKTMAILVLSVSAVCLTLFILAAFSILSGIQNRFPLWAHLLPGIACFFILLRRHKDGKILAVAEERWKNEPANQKRVRGFILIFSILVLLLFPICIGILRHNLHMDI